MSGQTILDWADQYVTGIGTAFYNYRKTNDSEILDEVRRGVSQLQALTEELIFRSGADI
jgi:hypothetical protein